MVVAAIVPALFADFFFFLEDDISVRVSLLFPSCAIWQSCRREIFLYLSAAVASRLEVIAKCHQMISRHPDPYSFANLTIESVVEVNESKSFHVNIHNDRRQLSTSSSQRKPNHTRLVQL